MAKMMRSVVLFLKCVLLIDCFISAKLSNGHQLKFSAHQISTQMGNQFGEEKCFSSQVEKHAF